MAVARAVLPFLDLLHRDLRLRRELRRLRHFRALIPCVRALCRIDRHHPVRTKRRIALDIETLEADRVVIHGHYRHVMHVAVVERRHLLRRIPKSLMAVFAAWSGERPAGHVPAMHGGELTLPDRALVVERVVAVAGERNAVRVLGKHLGRQLAAFRLAERIPFAARQQLVVAVHGCGWLLVLAVEEHALLRQHLPVLRKRRLNRIWLLPEVKIRPMSQKELVALHLLEEIRLVRLLEQTLPHLLAMERECLVAPSLDALLQRLVLLLAVVPFLKIVVSGDEKPLHMPAVASLVVWEHLEIRLGEELKRFNRRLRDISRHHNGIDLLGVEHAQDLLEHRKLFLLPAESHMRIGYDSHLQLHFARRHSRRFRRYVALHRGGCDESRY